MAFIGEPSGGAIDSEKGIALKMDAFADAAQEIPGHPHHFFLPYKISKGSITGSFLAGEITCKMWGTTTDGQRSLYPHVLALYILRPEKLNNFDGQARSFNMGVADFETMLIDAFKAALANHQRLEKIGFVDSPEEFAALQEKANARAET